MTIFTVLKNIYELAGEKWKKFSGGQCQRIGIAELFIRM